jgi:predicted RNase H-like nuclease (RuvC/YqgF family)
MTNFWVTVAGAASIVLGAIIQRLIESIGKKEEEERRDQERKLLDKEKKEMRQALEERIDELESEIKIIQRANLELDKINTRLLLKCEYCENKRLANAWKEEHEG